MKAPKLVMYYPHVVKTYGQDGEEIPSLCGPYTPELKARIDKVLIPSTEVMDVDADSMRLRYRDIVAAAMGKLWKAQDDNTIGGWSITVAEIPGTPADGNPTIANFMTEEMATHIVALHNESLS